MHVLLWYVSELNEYKFCFTFKIYSYLFKNFIFFVNVERYNLIINIVIVFNKLNTHNKKIKTFFHIPKYFIVYKQKTRLIAMSFILLEVVAGVWSQEEQQQQWSLQGFHLCECFLKYSNQSRKALVERHKHIILCIIAIMYIPTFATPKCSFYFLQVQQFYMQVKNKYQQI